MPDRRRSTVRIALLGALAALAATALFAPVLTSGWCYDATAGGESSCGSVQTSVLGIESNLWLWVVAMIVVVAMTSIGILCRLAVLRGRDRDRLIGL